MSTLEVSNLNDGTTTVATTFVTNGSAKAWCGWSGTSFGIIDSLNISSITDVGTGLYTTNYSSLFANIGYAVSTSGKESTGSAHSSNVDRLFHPSRVPYETGLTKYTAVNLSGTVQDLANCTSTIHGDLA
jgi:hypothetical protein